MSLNQVNQKPNSAVTLTDLPQWAVSGIEFLKKFFDKKRLPKQDHTVTVVFSDSGHGGAFAMMDFIRHSKKMINELHEKYNISFEFIHYGDTANAPYGTGKTAEEVRELSTNLIRYAAHDKTFGADIVIIACNTASVVYMDDMYEIVGDKIPKPIIPIIKSSAAYALEAASKLSKGDEPIYLTYLATPRTVESGKYEQYISRLKGVTVDKAKGYLSYRNPNDANAKEQKIKILSHGPEEWVRMIEEGATSEEMRKQVYEDVTKLVNKAKKDKLAYIKTNLRDGETAPKLRDVIHGEIAPKLRDVIPNIPVCGAFCTHYPIIKKLIKEAFEANGILDVEILAQGQVIHEKFKRQITDIIEAGIENGRIKERSSDDRNADNPSYTLHSYVTGTTKSAVEVLKVIADEFKNLGSTGKKPQTTVGKDKAPVDEGVMMIQQISEEVRHLNPDGELTLPKIIAEKIVGAKEFLRF